MGNPAGVRRDFDALERRRFQALRLLRQGLNQSEVARRLRVVRQSVARWAALDRKRGERALRQAGRAGRKPRLAEPQKAKLEQRLLAGPERLGYDSNLWSSQGARSLHFLALCSFIVFFIGHVTIVALHGFRSELALIVLGETHNPQLTLALVVWLSGLAGIVVIHVVTTVCSRRR